MTTAREEAERRVDEIREHVGFSDEQATWWITGFEKGAEWRASQPPVTEDEVKGDAKLPQNSATEDEREALADLIEGVGVYIAGSHGHDYINPNAAADAILAAGFRRSQSSPDWTDTQVEAADVERLRHYPDSRSGVCKGCGLFWNGGMHVTKAILSAASSARTTENRSE